MGQTQSIWSYKTRIHSSYYNWVKGTEASGTVMTEGGDKRNRWVEIVVDSTLPAIAGGADLAVAKQIYTFPAGVIHVRDVYMSIALDESDGNITADTPDLGIGTDAATGAYATLSACDSGETLTTENILTGQTMNDCNGTAEVISSSLDTGLVIAAAGDHEVYINVADGWAASGEAACGISGTVVLQYKVMS